MWKLRNFPVGFDKQPPFYRWHFTIDYLEESCCHTSSLGPSQLTVSHCLWYAVNSFSSQDDMCQWNWLPLFQIMAFCLVSSNQSDNFVNLSLWHFVNYPLRNKLQLAYTKYKKRKFRIRHLKISSTEYLPFLFRLQHVKSWRLSLCIYVSKVG